MVSVLRFNAIRDGSVRFSVWRTHVLHTRSIKNFRTSSVRIKSNGQRIYSVLDIFGSVFRFSSGSPGPVHSPTILSAKHLVTFLVVLLSFFLFFVFFILLKFLDIFKLF